MVGDIAGILKEETAAIMLLGCNTARASAQ